MKTIFTQLLKEKQSRESGVALLFVILLTSVLLLVAIGITNISYRETTFSIEAQDSDRAFFAADTGIECGLYLDNRGVFGPAGLGSYTCAGTSPYIVATAPIFHFVLPLGPRQCVEVDVNKAADPTGLGLFDYTSMSAVGYNVTASTTDPTVCISGAPGLRVVTRVLELEYPNGGTTGGGGSGTGTSGGPTSGGGSGSGTGTGTATIGGTTSDTSGTSGGTDMWTMGGPGTTTGTAGTTGGTTGGTSGGGTTSSGVGTTGGSIMWTMGGPGTTGSETTGPIF
jgi:hypothetical protein